MKPHKGYDELAAWARENAHGAFGALLACDTPTKHVVTFARSKWCIAGASWWDGMGYRWP